MGLLSKEYISLVIEGLQGGKVRRRTIGFEENMKPRIRWAVWFSERVDAAIKGLDSEDGDGCHFKAVCPGVISGWENYAAGALQVGKRAHFYLQISFLVVS